VCFEGRQREDIKNERRMKKKKKTRSRDKGEDMQLSKRGKNGKGERGEGGSDRDKHKGGDLNGRLRRVRRGDRGRNRSSDRRRRSG
jgi:hypothetical protein